MSEANLAFLLGVAAQAREESEKFPEYLGSDAVFSNHYKHMIRNLTTNFVMLDMADQLEGESLEIVLANRGSIIGSAESIYMYHKLLSEDPDFKRAEINTEIGYYSKADFEKHDFSVYPEIQKYLKESNRAYVWKSRVLLLEGVEPVFNVEK